MPDATRMPLYRYDHIDADPRAAPGSPQRLKWELVCARMDADTYRRRAKLASPDGRLSAQEHRQFMRLLAAAMAKSAELRRVLEAVADRTTLLQKQAGMPTGSSSEG